MSVIFEAALLMSWKAWDSLPRRSRIAISSVLHPVLPGPDGFRLFVDDHLDWDMDRPDMEEVDRVVRGEVREFDEDAGELFDFVMVPEDGDPATERTNMGPALDDMLGRALERYAAPHYDLWMMREAGITGPNAGTPEPRAAHGGDGPQDRVPDAGRGHLRMRCPHCGRETPVVGDVARWPVVTLLRVPVLEPMPGERPELSWGEAEIEAEFYYYCEHCGESLCDGLDDLQRILKEQRDAQGDGA